MFIFTEEIMSNKGIKRYVMGGSHDGRYEGNSRYRKLDING
jgi:hypothetical protein